MRSISTLHVTQKVSSAIFTSLWQRRLCKRFTNYRTQRSAPASTLMRTILACCLSSCTWILRSAGRPNVRKTPKIIMERQRQLMRTVQLPLLCKHLAILLRALVQALHSSHRRISTLNASIFITKYSLTASTTHCYSSSPSARMVSLYPGVDRAAGWSPQMTSIWMKSSRSSNMIW